jgi:hypothetical protein
VTWVFYAFATPSGGQMKFEITTSQGCRYVVVAADNGQPSASGDWVQLQYVSGECPPENTGVAPLTTGNIVWQ